MVDVKKFSEIDLYNLIGIDDVQASQTDIRKAYRKKALDCHPDKNPDNPKAAELFHELSKALEILTDPSARSAYDKILNARKAAKLRNKQLDGKRRKLKADLEERERAAGTTSKSSHHYKVNKTDEEKLRDEIERLRAEGSKLLQEEHEFLKNQLQKEKRYKTYHYESSDHRIKIKWKLDKKDPKTLFQYTEESLRFFMKKYGDIVMIVMSPKNNGTALIEFMTQEAGEMAVAYEKGNLQNPLQVEWIGGPPCKINNPIIAKSTTIKDTDFESLVMRQLRQAEERKRLIAQMLKEDKEEQN